MMRLNKFLSIVIYIFLYASACLALSPSKEYKQTPQRFRITYEEIKIPTPDGALLNAWYFPSSAGSQLIVMSHNGVENMSAYIDKVRLLLKYGYNVICYDYRGFGKSSDFEINKYQYVYKEFYTDFESVITYCTEKYREEIIAYGWGIGGGISIAKGFDNDDITGIIADNPFLEFNTLKSKFKQMQAIMVIPTNIETSEYITIDAVQRTPGEKLRGILYFHGSRNYFYTLEDMEALVNTTNISNKELVGYDKPKDRYKFALNESIYARKIYEFVMNL